MNFLFINIPSLQEIVIHSLFLILVVVNLIIVYSVFKIQKIISLKTLIFLF